MDGGELLEFNCPVCFGEYSGDPEFATLICGHIFHEQCLTKALKFKKQCPICRCPARLLDGGRTEAGGKKLQCPCKTGAPLKLFQLQRPRSGALSQAAVADGSGGSAVDSAVLAAVEQRAAQRESRLKEALQEERRKAMDLELQFEKQLEELVKAQEKAERRKQRLAAMERDHQLALVRLAEDKSRLEARERELSEELTRVRQALHGARMDLDKARAAVYERDDAVMRLKRELALQRARAGGSAAPQPREMAELLGERKEDWQAVYSLKVEELRRANEVAAELRSEVARGKTDADARVAAERLAGAERVKAVAQERDEVKRELMELEYKLHEAQRRLSELPPRPPEDVAAGAGPSTAAPSSRPDAPLRAPLHPVMMIARQQPPQPHPQRAAVGAAGGGGRVRPQPHTRPGAVPAAGGRSSQGSSSRQEHAAQGRRDVAAPVAAAAEDTAAVAAAGVEDDDDGDLEALALEALSCLEAEEEADEGRRRIDRGAADADAEEEDLDGADSEEDGHVGIASGAAVARGCPLEEPLVCRGSGGACGSDGGGLGGQDDEDPAGDSTPYDMEASAEIPPSKRQRYCGAATVVTAAADGDASCRDVQMYDSGELVDEGEPVPRLPGSFSGLYMGGAPGLPLGRAPQGAGGATGAAKPGDGLASSGPGGGAFRMSFAGKTDAARWAQGRLPGGGGGGGLLGDGPDGRGGSVRFPLTSSFAHNAGARKAAAGSKTTARGGSSGRGGPVAPQGRIEAFLRPIAPPNRR